ncbi:MAG: hypothetical protein V1708_06300 [Candidatus Micrarchaeota archaeon]
MAIFAAKEFLRPTKARLVVFIVLFLFGGIFGFVAFGRFATDSPRLYGFPFAMNSAACTEMGMGWCVNYAYSMEWLGILIDAAIWYLAACALVFAYAKLVKK